MTEGGHEGDRHTTETRIPARINHPAADVEAVWTDAATELFVYYRVDSLTAHLAWPAVRAFQQQLCAAHPGLQARLLRRPEMVEEQQTWMETYRFGATPPDQPVRGVDAALQAAIELAALPLSRFVPGPRHTERFIPCA